MLGTALIVALLGMSALIGQRIQNRMLVGLDRHPPGPAQRQHGRRAGPVDHEAGHELAHDLLQRQLVRQSRHDGRHLHANVTDPVDANLANNADDPVVMTGIGYSGDAEQRVKVTVDPRKDPLSCLRSAVAVGDARSLCNGDTLRTNGLITANQVSAHLVRSTARSKPSPSAARPTTARRRKSLAEKRPTMPDWTRVFSYYRTNGTEININSLPTQTPNLGRNTSFETDTSYWTGTATGLPTADTRAQDRHRRPCRVLPGQRSHGLIPPAHRSTSTVS